MSPSDSSSGTEGAPLHGQNAEACGSTPPPPPTVCYTDIPEATTDAVLRRVAPAESFVLLLCLGEHGMGGYFF